MDTSRLSPDYTFLYKPLQNVQGGGCSMAVWIPKDAPPPTPGYPVAMMFHGGGFIGGTRTGIPYNQVRYLQKRGVVVVSSSYRMTPHVGAAEIRTDLVDAARFVQTKLNNSLEQAGSEARVDGKRSCAMGWSAGGISSLWLAADMLKLSKAGQFHPIRAVITTYPIADFNGLYDKPLPEDDHEFAALRDHLLQQPCVTDFPLPTEPESESEQYLRLLPDGNETRLQWVGKLMTGQCLSTNIVGQAPPFDPSQSTVNVLSADFPPTCVVLADADELIPTSNSKAIYEKLSDLNCTTKLVVARNMKHGEAEVLEGMFKWTDEHGWWEEAILPSLDFAIEHL